MLRKALDTATKAFFRCEAGGDTSAASLQSRLASFLHADRSKRDETHSTEDGIYGANLAVHIQPAAGLPNSFFVVLTFDIECGDDNLLFLYTRDSVQWVQRLHWYSDKYTNPSDAFGGGFAYAVVPGPDDKPLLAVIHGHPWCTSVHSGFGLDLMRPAAQEKSQEALDHVDHSFVIDDEFKFLSTRTGIRLRTSLESEDVSLIYHLGILSWRTTSGKLVLEPVALNARDFVDEWLEEPWSTVQSWSDPAAIERLKPRHTTAGVIFGPVRACRNGGDRFQVELDLDRSDSDPPPVFAQVRQNPNSFTMLSFTDKPDPACTGPDLMKSSHRR